MFALMPWENIITTEARRIFKGRYCSIIITNVAIVILVMVTDFFLLFYYY